MIGAMARLVAIVADGEGGYRYTRPFIQPLPVWNHWVWLLLPLCAAVAIVYKSIRCRYMKDVRREATQTFFFIVGGIALAALALAALDYLVAR